MSKVKRTRKEWLDIAEDGAKSAIHRLNIGQADTETAVFNILQVLCDMIRAMKAGAE